MYCSLQNHSGGYHLTPVKALSLSLQGYSTNLDSHSTWYSLPFPTYVSCPAPGVDTIIWTHLSDQRAVTSPGTADIWRDEGKREHINTQGTGSTLFFAHHSYSSSGWRASGGGTMSYPTFPLPYLQCFLPLEAALSVSAQNGGACSQKA